MWFSLVRENIRQKTVYFLSNSWKTNYWLVLDWEHQTTNIFNLSLGAPPPCPPSHAITPMLCRQSLVRQSRLSGFPDYACWPPAFSTRASSWLSFFLHYDFFKRGESNRDILCMTKYRCNFLFQACNRLTYFVGGPVWQLHMKRNCG